MEEGHVMAGRDGKEYGVTVLATGKKVWSLSSSRMKTTQRARSIVARSLVRSNLRVARKGESIEFIWDHTSLEEPRSLSESEEDLWFAPAVVIVGRPFATREALIAVQDVREYGGDQERRVIQYEGDTADRPAGDQPEAPPHTLSRGIVAPGVDNASWWITHWPHGKQSDAKWKRLHIQGDCERVVVHDESSGALLRARCVGPVVFEGAKQSANTYALAHIHVTDPAPDASRRDIQRHVQHMDELAKSDGETSLREFLDSLIWISVVNRDGTR